MGGGTRLDSDDQHDEIENVSTTPTFVTALTVNGILPRESTFVIHNKGSGDLSYQILGNIRDISKIVEPTGTNDDDKGWIVLKDSTSIAADAVPAKETLSNPYTQILVQIKHLTSTTTVNIYHKGEA